MKIGLIGNYGATNIGDDAILNAILKSHSNHEFVVFSANPKKTEAQFGVKAVPLLPLGFRSTFKHGFRKSFKALRSVDAVILGGGGLMQDDKAYACMLWAWQIHWVKFFNKPLFVYGTGVGPLKTWLGKKLSRYVHEDAIGITVRDKASEKLLAKLSLERENIEPTADPAFLFKHVGHEPKRVAHTYMVSLRPWRHYNEQIISTFTRYLLKLKEEKGAKFIFTAMQSIKEHDRKVLNPIMERVGGALFVPKHFSEVIQKMEEVEFAIGMRYHFLIASLITKTPTLAISYSPKVDSLFKETSLEPYMMAIEELSEQNLERKMTRLSADYNNIKVYSKFRAEELRGAAEKNIEYFEGFVNELEKDRVKE